MLRSLLDGEIPDAPIDGTGYVRKDGAWAPESGGGGDTDTVANVSTVPGVTCSDALEAAYAAAGAAQSTADGAASAAAAAQSDATAALTALSALDTDAVANASGVAGVTCSDALDALATLAGGKVGEAPSDDRTYGRRNAAWADTYRGQVVTASGTAAAGFQTIHTFVLAVGQDPICFRLECEFKSSSDSALHGVLVAEGSVGRGSASATASIMPRIADNVPGTQTANVLVAGPNVQVRMSFGATACDYKARIFYWPWTEVT